MICYIAEYLKSYLSFFNVFHYVSFRSIMSLLSTLGMSVLWGNGFIGASKQFFRASSRAYTPATHRVKDDMPTMGGIFIIAMVIINTLLWCKLTDVKVWFFVLVILAYGVIGCLDDWQKIKYKQGISAKMKFSLQCLCAGIIMGALVLSGVLSPTICVPFFKDMCIVSGLWFIVWAAFIVVGASNAVNLTDGLDGLAIGALIPNFAIFGIINYLAGHKQLAAYLHIPYVHSEEMAVICAILVGASLGFLWFNTYPAQIFMGDVGALSLGSALAYVALISKQELLLPIAGGLFVLETLSVILQVLSIKLVGRRLFRMAPIHHHFELLGWPESRITMRFCIISLILCLLALVTIKIR